MADVCRTLADDSPLPIAVTQGETHVVRYASPALCRLLGRPADGVVGRSLTQVLPTSQVEAATNLMDRVFRTGTPEPATGLGQPGQAHGMFIAWPFQGDDRRPAGLVVQISDTTSLVLALQSDAESAQQLLEVNQRLLVAGLRSQEQADAAESISAALVDVAEAHRLRLIAEQEARDAAEDALRVRDRFLSIAAHELRTPVTAVKLASQVVLADLYDGTLDPDRAARHLSGIVLAADRLEALIRDLMDVSRMRSGHLLLELRPMELSALVDTVALRYSDIVSVNHRLVMDLPSTPLVLVGDPWRLEQVVENLFSNAMKYSPDGGAVSVRLCRVPASGQDADGALLSVTDSGIGLPASEHEAIFEPFGRATNAVQSGIPGMGLGLHISRQIVEGHGGRLWAESIGANEGTTFWMWLPLEQPAP
jgi:signal transduction histidine kinase